MKNELGVTLPKRKHLDWRSATTGVCGCGKLTAMVNGKCPECHDAEFLDAKQEAYENRIRELMAEKKDLALQFEKDEFRQSKEKP